MAKTAIILLLNRRHPRWLDSQQPYKHRLYRVWTWLLVAHHMPASVVQAAFLSSEAVPVVENNPTQSDLSLTFSLRQHQ